MKKISKQQQLYHPIFHVLMYVALFLKSTNLMMLTFLANKMGKNYGSGKHVRKRHFSKL